MIKRLQSILLVFYCVNIFSQFDNIKNFHLYTSPLQAADFYSRPIVTLGCEYVFFDRIGLSTEIGYKYKDIYHSDTDIVRSKGYSYRIELKYYHVFLHRTRKLKDYFSLEYRYINDNYNTQIGFYESYWKRNKLFKDDFGVLQSIYIGNIKYGMIFRFANRFFIDFYSGVGLRYRDVKNINREYDDNLGHFIWYDVDSQENSYSFKETAGKYFNISLGCKFGIRF